jgi:hypothetical protein
MDDAPDFVARESVGELSHIGDVDVFEGESGTPEKPCEARFLEADFVVVVEVVNTKHHLTSIQ